MPKSKARVSDDNESESRSSSSSSDSTSTASDSSTRALPSTPKAKKQNPPSAASSASVWNEEGRLALSEKRFVTAKWFKGLVYVDIRDYYWKDGVMTPSPKNGIRIHPYEWAILRANIRHIDKKLKDLDRIELPK
ncbi:activated RNA polymerase II transcriptional coactivator p15-like [Symsagittifera roscoffensis]|uniref:activated RNA polymerase II transcriptional coactivator p15-like n=1 Tax=Symsagittifera roscoffensis TaxID=84072 RepID=UPI00307BBA3F